MEGPFKTSTSVASEEPKEKQGLSLKVSSLTAKLRNEHTLVHLLLNNKLTSFDHAHKTLCMIQQD